MHCQVIGKFFEDTYSTFSPFHEWVAIGLLQVSFSNKHPRREQWIVALDGLSATATGSMRHTIIGTYTKLSTDCVVEKQVIAFGGRRGCRGAKEMFCVANSCAVSTLL
jgi:hypothetical protein